MFFDIAGLLIGVAGIAVTIWKRNEIVRIVNNKNRDRVSSHMKKIGTKIKTTMKKK